MVREIPDFKAKTNMLKILLSNNRGLWCPFKPVCCHLYAGDVLPL